MKLYTLAAAALVASALSAQAATINPSTGLDLRADATQGSDVKVFSEKTDVTIGEDQVTVDFLVGTNINVGDSKIGLNNFAGGAVLAADTYNSFLLHFDPVNTSRVSNFSVDFGYKIVGLVLSNSGSQRLLNLSDATFGTAAFFDKDGSRRAENNDAFTLTSATSVNFNFYAGVGYTDNVRILTEVVPVPLPATLPLALIGLGGLAMMRRRTS